MAWTDAAREAALAARRARMSANSQAREAQQPNESRYVKLERFYDRHSRNAVVQPVFKSTGYEAGRATVVAKLRQAKAIPMDRQDVARELADRRGTASDPRPAFRPKESDTIVLHRAAATDAVGRTSTFHGKGSK